MMMTQAVAVAQHPSGSGTAPASPARHCNGVSRPAGTSAAVTEQSLVRAASGEDDDDDDVTVMPGNSRLVARVLAGRQSLAPPRPQARHSSMRPCVSAVHPVTKHSGNAGHHVGITSNNTFRVPQDMNSTVYVARHAMLVSASDNRPALGQNAQSGRGAGFRPAQLHADATSSSPPEAEEDEATVIIRRAASAPVGKTGAAATQSKGLLKLPVLAEHPPLAAAATTVPVRPLLCR